MSAKNCILQLSKLLCFRSSTALTHQALEGWLQPSGLSCAPWWSQLYAGVRTYKSPAKRRHHLSIINKASELAVEPFLQKQPSGKDTKPKPEPITSAIPSLPPLQEPRHYRRVGRLTKGYNLQPQQVFAVVQLGAHQFKVTATDIIYVDRLKDVDINEVVALDRVMLLGSQHSTVVGRPFVPNATVLAAVEEQFKDGKILVFKKKRRKRYTKSMGARAHLTALRVLEVAGIEEQPGVPAKQMAKLPIQSIPTPGTSDIV